VRVVSDAGLRNLTYRAVTPEARVTHGLVTRHFGTREASIAAALRYSLDNSISGITSEPGLGRIELLFRELPQLVADSPETQVFQYELTLEVRRTAGLREDVHEPYRGYREALRLELDAAGLKNDALAHLVFAALDGLVFQQTCQVNDVPIEAALDELRKILTLLQERG